jgi:hypothetical protein
LTSIEPTFDYNVLLGRYGGLTQDKLYSVCSSGVVHKLDHPPAVSVAMRESSDKTGLTER